MAVEGERLLPLEGGGRRAMSWRAMVLPDAGSNHR